MDEAELEGLAFSPGGVIVEEPEQGVDLADLVGLNFEPGGVIDEADLEGLDFEPGGAVQEVHDAQGDAHGDDADDPDPLGLAAEIEHDAFFVQARDL